MSEPRYCHCRHPEEAHEADGGCTALVEVTHENDDGEVEVAWDEPCDCERFDWEAAS